jgi:hypothetical protein
MTPKTADAVAHREQSGCSVAHHQRNAQRRDALGAAHAERLARVLDRAHATDPGPDYAADEGRVERRCTVVPAGIRHCLGTRRDRELREAIAAASLLDRHHARRIELAALAQSGFDPRAAGEPALV